MHLDKLQVAGNGFLFKFEQDVTADGMFREEKYNGLIEIQRSVDSSVKASRWATVLKIGSDIKDPGIHVGARVLIEPLQWSRNIKLEDGSSVWKSDETKVLAVEE